MGTDEFLGLRSLDFHPIPGQWYDIKIEVCGDRIRVFLNNEKLPRLDVIDKNSNLAPSGEVTLGGGWIETEFDDLVVTPMSDDQLKNVKAEEYTNVVTPQEKESKRQLERAQYTPIQVKTLSEGRTEVSLDGNWLFMPEYQLDDKDKAVSSQEDSDWHVDITDEAKPGTEQLLAVRVTNPGGNFHWQDFDMLKWGEYNIPPARSFSGIIGRVWLESVNSVFISDIYMQNTPELTKVNAIVSFTNETASDVKRDIELSVGEKANPDKVVFRKTLKKFFFPPGNHVYLGADMHTLKAVNSGYKCKLKIDNHSTSAKVEVITGKKYSFEPIPKNIKTDIDVHPRPVSDKVLKADLARATGFNNNRPVKDVSAELQSALDAVKAAGGGTLYLPAGRYLVDNPVKVPSGVELRGS